MTPRICSRYHRPATCAALAAATALTLAACAGRPDTGPDRPFTTANICADFAIPQGWIRTNDWHDKGCGDEESEAAHAQLASAAAPGRTKPRPPRNNWMTITQIAHARIGRSLTACAGDVPDGWVETARYWDKGRCGNPTKPSIKNVMLIERVK
jgi:hypothetical protein